MSWIAQCGTKWVHSTKATSTIYEFSLSSLVGSKVRKSVQHLFGSQIVSRNAHPGRDNGGVELRDMSMYAACFTHSTNSTDPYHRFCGGNLH